MKTEIKTAEEILKSVLGIRIEAVNLTPMDKGECILCMNEYANQFKPKWISVEDGLPEVKIIGEFYASEYMAVLCSENFPLTARLEKGIGDKSFITQWYDPSVDDIIDVTHWMPLPTPPEQ